jgi:hypothetical protein
MDRLHQSELLHEVGEYFCEAIASYAREQIAARMCRICGRNGAGENRRHTNIFLVCVPPK